jgi:lauroyl/myristoyl acyltransferase
MTGAGVDRPAETRGTTVQRARASLVGALGTVLGHLPATVVGGLCDAAGELWYRATPGRAARARGNLAHVAGWLAATGRGSARARSAATDPAALEHLVRAAFRHSVRMYAETLRGAASARDLRRRLLIEVPAPVDAAFATPGPVVFVTAHFGSMAGAATVLGDHCRVPITGPMETIGDPELQRLLLRARESGGARIVGLDQARRALRGALMRGEGVGLVADRDIAGGGLPVIFFGRLTTLPMGPAYLALEHGAPLHVAAVWRAKGEAFRGGLITVPHPPTDLPRRARIEALLQAEAEAFETFISRAPEQWWTVFFPIWEEVGPRTRGSGSTTAGSPATGGPAR